MRPSQPQFAVQGDVLSLKTDVGRGLSSVSGAAAAASANVALLVQLERVKSRMEAACSTLKVCDSSANVLQRAGGIVVCGSCAVCGWEKRCSRAAVFWVAAGYKDHIPLRRTARAFLEGLWCKQSARQACTDRWRKGQSLLTSCPSMPKAAGCAQCQVIRGVLLTLIIAPSRRRRS